MILFYSKNISEENRVLSETESNHCIFSLRKKINDKIFITEGKGEIYSGIISEIKNNRVIYKNLSIQETEKRKINIHIAIAPTKNKTRFEWFLEKSTEIGIDSISPLICENSERKNINIERCEKILISAMKQSKSSILPKLNALISFRECIDKFKKNGYIAHCQNSKKQDFKHILNASKRIQTMTIFIGPEGDFSKKEITFAENTGIIPINLSNKRLRTETAGIVACNMINFVL